MKYFFLPLFLLFFFGEINILKSQPSQILNQNNNLSDSGFSNHYAIILNDEQEIKFSGKAFNLITCTFTRHLKIKLLSQNGVKYLSNIKIPYQTDPTEIIHAPEKRNQRFYLDKIQVNNFTIALIDSNGRKRPTNTTQHAIEYLSTDFYDNRYDTYYDYFYSIEDLKTGDVFDINYKYTVPFGENLVRLSSFRMFLHDSLPKINFRLRLQMDDNIANAIKFVNGGEPDSNYLFKSTRVMVWNKSNLPGCVKETGGRPYLSLPFINVNITPVDMYYRIPYTFDLAVFPLYVFPVYFRQLDHLPIVRSVDYGSTRNQFVGMNSFIKSTTTNIPVDPTGYNHLERIQAVIADEFCFDEDVNYFRRVDNSDGNLGEEAKARVLKDINRTDFYVALLSMLKLGYFTAYPVDKRSGEISPDCVSSMFFSDYLISPSTKDETLHFIYPKSSRYGLYLDELPFFFENVKARLIHLNDYCDLKKPISTSFRETTTPKTPANENLRITLLNMFLDLDSGTVTVVAKVTLSGQFSTLGRGSYLYNVTIPTVNKAYSFKIWEIHPSIKLIDSSVKVLTRIKPFTTEVKARFYCNSILTKHDSGFRISLHNFLPFLTQKGLTTLGRTLDFYPDFQYREDYHLDIKFNKDVELVESINEVYIWNSFGKLTFVVRQKEPKIVSIQASNLVTTDKVNLKDIHDVENIYKQVLELSGASICVRLK